jgi:AcrR family transcriptional regulator
VGARGQRTQQRILDAALEVFGEEGFHRCSIDRITTVAGCSRVSFYQYFASKEDVFRVLTGIVARQLAAAHEAIEPVTPDAGGWSALRSLVGRYGDVYERYEPVFRTFAAAAEGDEVLTAGSARTTERRVAGLRAKLTGTRLPTKQLDATLALLLECMTQTHYVAAALRAAAPGSYPREQVEDAFADVMHRTLFGLDPAVNVHLTVSDPPSMIPFAPEFLEALRAEDTPPALTAAGRRTLDALLDAGRTVFVRRGYHATRVDDVVTEAGVSHGAFYRYFRNKDHLAVVLAVRAMRTASGAFTDLPPEALAGGEEGAASLRRWLRRYNSTTASETVMVRLLADARIQDAQHGGESAGAYDWGRRRMARLLAGRGFGDPETEALVMVAVVGAFGEKERSPATVDAAARIIERGLFGLA